MKTLCLVVALSALPVQAENALDASSASVSAKLFADLPDVLDNAAPDELIPIKAIMRDQVPRQRIQEARWANPDRDVRRGVIKEMLKTLADETQKDLLEFLRQGQEAGTVGERIRTLWLSNVVAADVTPDVVRQIAARDDVALVAHNPMVPIFEDPVAEGGAFGEIECGVELMQAPKVWNELGITGRGAVIAMIDSGTCRDHPDLANQIWDNEDEIPNNGIDDDNNGFIDDTWGWNFKDNNNNPMDWYGHGTHTSGTVGGDGTGGTQTGMAPDCLLMALCVSGSFSDEQMVWDAMQYAVDNEAHAWNMSLGWPHNRNPVRATWRRNCENAIAMGCAPVIAAGNEGTCCPPYDHVRTPGDVPDVITVGATDCNDVIAGFSSRGPVTWQDIPPWKDCVYPPGCIKPSVSAPGVNTKSTRNCSGYQNMSGTSMATPHVAGAVALMIESNPDLSPEEIKECLMETALDLGEPGMDNVYGAGRVNAYEAVLACTGDPVPAACCFGDESCRDLLRTDCLDAGGRWFYGRNCDEIECPKRGACCFDDGSCEFLIQTACAKAGGKWTADEDCDSFRCPQPGACCIDDSTCEIMLESQCEQREGNFRGEEVPCKNACPCDKIRRLKGKCSKGGTIKAIMKFRDKSMDGETVVFGIGERLRLEATIRGKKAKLYTCCFNGPTEISVKDPKDCGIEPKVVNCPD